MSLILINIKIFFVYIKTLDLIFLVFSCSKLIRLCLGGLKSSRNNHKNLEDVILRYQSQS